MNKTLAIAKIKEEDNNTIYKSILQEPQETDKKYNIENISVKDENHKNVLTFDEIEELKLKTNKKLLNEIKETLNLFNNSEKLIKEKEKVEEEYEIKENIKNKILEKNIIKLKNEEEENETKEYQKKDKETDNEQEDIEITEEDLKENVNKKNNVNKNIRKKISKSQKRKYIESSEGDALSTLQNEIEEPKEDLGYLKVQENGKIDLEEFSKNLKKVKNNPSKKKQRINIIKDFINDHF